MRKNAYLFLTLMLALVFTSCKDQPQYIYVDNMGDEAKVSFIEGESDDDAYAKAFENYSNARFYPVF